MKVLLVHMRQHGFKAAYAVVISFILIFTVPAGIQDFSRTTNVSLSTATTTPTQDQAEIEPVVAALSFVPTAEAHVVIPNTLKISAIGIDAPVVATGIAADGRMEVPDDFTHIGWYKFGAHPGEIGSTVMGAHVDNGGKIAGVFKKLKYVKVGNDIVITDTDGNTYHYKVVSRKIYNYKTTFTQEVFNVSDTARLNLITCYGTWLPKEKTYNERLVVFAELVQ